MGYISRVSRLNGHYIARRSAYSHEVVSIDPTPQTSPWLSLVETSGEGSQASRSPTDSTSHFHLNHIN